MQFDNQYLEYDEYVELGGELEEMPFNLLEFNARKIVDSKTQGRLIGSSDIPDEVKMCVFRLIDCINRNIDNNKTNVASKSIDGVSVSYVTDVEKIIKNKNYELEDIVLENLSYVVYNNEHLIYIGVK